MTGTFQSDTGGTSIPLLSMEGVVEAPDAHYGHMNRYVDVYNHNGISTVVEYITKMMRVPETSAIPNKIRIRLDKTSAE